MNKLQITDCALAVLVAAGILILPVLFVLGGRYTQWAWTRGAGRPAQRWFVLLIYSSGVLALWLGLGALRVPQFGSSIGWLVSLGVMIGYSSYLVPPVAVLTILVSLAAIILERVKGPTA